MKSDQKYKELVCLMFLKKKRCGKFKGCGCADGRKQYVNIKKYDTSPLTVSTEVILLSWTMYATEGRDMATVDIPSAFMQVDMDGEIDMKLEGTMTDLFTKLNPKSYRKYVRT